MDPCRHEVRFWEITPAKRISLMMAVAHRFRMLISLLDKNRLFNDHWYPLGSHDCGIWIARDGLSQEVHRDRRGTKFRPGDEIHFGRAVVVFEGE